MGDVLNPLIRKSRMSGAPVFRSYGRGVAAGGARHVLPCYPGLPLRAKFMAAALRLGRGR